MLQRNLAMIAMMFWSVMATTACASEAAAWDALQRGGIALFRHANAPGGGDPPGMRIGDCSTQRNLDETGRTQARRIGDAFSARGVAINRVLTSQWCRTVETAELAFPGRVLPEPIFNSFFDDRRNGPAQTRAALEILKEWRGPGALVVTTHQVNITGLTGVVPSSGEGIVVRWDGQALQVVGRIRP